MSQAFRVPPNSTTIEEAAPAGSQQLLNKYTTSSKEQKRTKFKEKKRIILTNQFNDVSVASKVSSSIKDQVGNLFSKQMMNNFISNAKE